MADNMNINPKTGNQYRITMDKDEFDTDKTGDVILMANENGSGVLMPQFKEDQKTDVKAFIKGQIKNYIDQKSEKRPFQEPGVDYAPEYVYNRGQGAKTAREEGNMLAKLYSGNAGEITAALDYFNGLSDVNFVKRTPSGISVTLSNGETKPIRFKNPDGTLVSQEDFIRSASSLLLGSDVDINEALKGAVSTGRKSFNNTVSASSSTQKPAAPATAEQKAKGYLTSKITAGMLNQTESKAVPQILSVIGKLGFDAEESGVGSYVTITSPGSKGIAGISKQFSLQDGEAAAAKTRQDILDFVTANLSQEKLTNAERAGVLGGNGELD
jgi:hypothetical protein